MSYDTPASLVATLTLPSEEPLAGIRRPSTRPLLSLAPEEGTVTIAWGGQRLGQVLGTLAAREADDTKLNFELTPYCIHVTAVVLQGAALPRSVRQVSEPRFAESGPPALRGRAVWRPLDREETPWASRKQVLPLRRSAAKSTALLQ